jgi:hypothetical protein
MPPSMDTEEISQSVSAAIGLANLQPSSGSRQRSFSTATFADPATSQSNRISPEDLRVMREKFPMLNDFSEQFLQSRTLDELLRIESTSLRIKDAERARETEEKLAQNKSNLGTKFYEVQQGRDNRWSELHPARFLPGVACTAVKEFMAARDVIGLSNPPAVSCYDMTSVGMGGYVTPKGWYELGNIASTKLRVSMFNINNCAKSSSSKSADSDDCEMKDIEEFKLALRTLRVAAFFACNWNKSFLALENYLLNHKFHEDVLKHDPNPARTLCQFSDFVLSENSNHWRDGSGFLTTGELTAYWDSFIGARPIPKPSTFQPSSQVSQAKSQFQQGKFQAKPLKKRFPPTDICAKWNVGHCQKANGNCYNFNGQQLRHVCNWRDPANPNSNPCGQAHTRRGNH